MAGVRASFTQTLTLKLDQKMKLRLRPPLTWSLLELSTVCDSDPPGGSPSTGTERLHFFDHVHSLLYAAKDNVFTIQPRWRKRSFIIAAAWKVRQSVKRPLVHGFLLGDATVFCNDSAILGHRSNPFFCFHAKTLQEFTASNKNFIPSRGEKKPLWNGT